MTFLRCLRCALPNTRPDSPFTDGICPACHSYERRPTIDWAARRAELLALLDAHDGEVLVPSSGGKDSTAQVLMLQKLGAHVTIVTASTCMLTDTGRKNIDNLARYATTLEITPNRAVRAKLNRLGLEMVGDISWPEHAAIFSIPFRMACTLGIPLLMFGESPQNQYGGPLGSDEAKQLTLRWRSEFGGFLGLRAADFVGKDDITAQDMKIYEAPRADSMESCNVEAHFLGQYLPWDSHANADAAIAAGMKCQLPTHANFWAAENQDNAQTGVHDWFCYLKYGFGRLCAQVSVDVRTGEMLRPNAMELVRERDGLFPLEYMGVGIDAVLARVGLTRADFIEIANRFLNRDLFDGDVVWGERPRLRA